MASILEGEIAQTITEALIDAGIPYDVVITRTIAEPGENDYTEPTLTSTDYTAKGFTETFTADYIAGGLVQANDLKVIILASTLTITPELSDLVTVRGKTYAIVSIMPDPALATIALQVRS